MRQYIDTFTSSYHKDTKDLVLFNCGTEQCDADHFFGPIARDFNLIHFVSKGKGNLIIDEINHPINENQAFLYQQIKLRIINRTKQILGPITGLDLLGLMQANICLI